MKILFLGAGGTGGYFGGRLAIAGSNVTFLVREKRAAQIARDGLVIETSTENHRIAVKTVLASTVKPEYDLIVLSCKAYDLDSSIAAIAPAMADKTLVLPLLNGMSHLDKLDAAFGVERVMGGSCQIAATLTADGIVKNLADTHVILWGARTPSQQSLADALGHEFANTPVTWRVSDDIIQDMWEKLVFLSTLAGMTCLMRGSVGDVLAAKDGRALMLRYLESCIAIATREGFPPRADIMVRYQAVMDSVGSTLKASMLRDIEAGNEIEADHIVGFMRDKARQYAIDDSMLIVAYAHLQSYQHIRQLRRQATGDK